MVFGLNRCVMSGGVHYLAWASLPDLDRFSWRRGECWLARCFGVGGVTSRGLALGCGVCAGSEDDFGGATSVQLVWSSCRGTRQMDHSGSAHTSAELEVLRAAIRQCLASEGKNELDFGDDPPQRGALLIRSSRAQHL